MNRNTVKMLLRSIKSSLGRYMAIMAIVALGVGFFAGLKSSEPAMSSTADKYMRQQKMYDFQLLSSLGLREEDVRTFTKLDGIAAAEGGYSVDALVQNGEKQGAYKFLSVTDEICMPKLVTGRMPEKPGECLADSQIFDESDLGKTIVLSDTNEENTLDMFACKSYTVVGTAKTPRFISSDRGTTSLGSGKINGFIMLPPEGFDSPVYHEILLYCDFPGEMYSDEYDSARDKLTAKVNAQLNRCGADRYEEVKAEVDKELADARKELDNGWSSYYAGENEARNQLVAGREKLEQGELELEQGFAQIEENQQKINEGYEKIPGALEEIANNRVLLDEKAAELEAGKKQLDASAQELADGRIKLEAAKKLALAPYQLDIELRRNAADIARGALDAAMELPVVDDALIAYLEGRLAEKQAELQAAQDRYNAKAAEFAPQEEQLAAGEAEIQKQRELIGAGEQEIVNARAQLDSTEKELRKTYDALPESQKQLDAAKTELENGRTELENGWAEYHQGEQEAQARLAEGRKQLEDAELQLENAKSDAYEQIQLDLYTLTRNENQGYATFESDVGIVAAIANIFPVFFALIAALVCITTMTRMVTEERTQIGTLKAMGYSSAVIMSKYLLYSGSSALIGCVLGFQLGITAIPYIIWLAYGILYDYAKLQLYFSVSMYAGCTVASVIGTVAVTWYACHKELAEKPAELVRPKVQGKGKRILLEHIKPVWKRMSFLNKVTIRNALRYKQRVLMMIVGIGGCTALLVTGFGVRDSVMNVLSDQFDEICMYDISVIYDPEKMADRNAVEKYWKDESRDYAMVYQTEADVSAGETVKSLKLIASDGEDLNGIISLHDRKGELTYPKEGEAIINDRLSDMLGVKTGDPINVKTEDGLDKTLTVSGICENYVGNYIYVSPETVDKLPDNSAFICVDEEKNAEAFGAELRSKEGIGYVSIASQERRMMEDSMASLDMVVLLLIVCSGALAFITLYNLTNINILERIREVATVKVLGFYPGETASYILRENLMLTFLGAVVGLFVGKTFHRAVIGMIQVEYMSFGTKIAPLSFVLGFVITIIFAYITNLVMRTKLNKVNMAESLKSVE